MVMVTGQQPRLLESQPALGLEIGALGTGPMPTRVVPDARHMAVGTRLDMTAQRGRPALHDGARGFADVGGQRMGLLVGGKRVLEDRLQRDERHRCLRTYGIRASSGVLYSITPTIPADKRLVQEPLSEIGYVLGETRAMANWEHLTEILPKSYNVSDHRGSNS